MFTLLTNVWKRYGERDALSSINLKIDDGQCVAILGPKGSGKTTLLRLVAGLEALTEGEIRMRGKRVATKSMSLPADERPIQLVEPATMESSLSQFVDGPQDPSPIVLLDNPLVDIDPQDKIKWCSHLKSLHRQKKMTIVYATDNQTEALAVAEKLVIVNKGRVEQSGHPEEVYVKPETPFVASYVCQANVMKGMWFGHHFKAFADSSMIWTSTEVSSRMKEAGYFPVRPEQFTLFKQGKRKLGMPGIVRNVLYQGKELHYVVEVNGMLLNVHTDLSTRFSIDDEVQVAFPEDVKVPQQRTDQLL